MSHDAPIYRFFPVAAVALFALTACGGGGGATSGPPIGSQSQLGDPVPPTPVPPSPTSTPGSAAPLPGSTALVSASPNALAFQTAGPGAAGQSVVVQQPQNTGGFALGTTNCAAVVSVTPATGVGPFTFLPIGAGTCRYVVTGNGGAAATIGITVTTTTIHSK